MILYKVYVFCSNRKSTAETRGPKSDLYVFCIEFLLKITVKYSFRYVVTLTIYLQDLTGVKRDQHLQCRILFEV